MIYIKGTLVISILLLTYLTAVMAESNEMSEFANTAFATSLYDVLKKTTGNVFFSPYSLQVALAMTYSGATGNTAKELQHCLAFSENKDALYKAVKASTASLRSSSNVTLNIANGMFVQKDYPLKEPFTKNIKGIFEAEVKSLNFGANVEAAKEINEFVNKSTSGKITELFSADAFNALTRLVLVNAIYFKGSWMNKFDPANTFKGDFHLNNKQKVQVDYMTITKKFNAAEDDTLKATIVELPYEGELSMVLIVPNEIEGIKHLENNIKKINLRNLTEATYSKEVNLTMPKFKLEQKIDLLEPLEELGIKDMFDSTKANFAGITEKDDLYVSKVVQKAFIEVNEEGSEAAAATACHARKKRSVEYYESLVLSVDHPFIFYIKRHDIALFAGCLRIPDSGEISRAATTQKRSSEWLIFGTPMKCSNF